MKQTIKSILAFAAILLCGGAWAATWTGDLQSTATDVFAGSKITFADFKAAMPAQGENAFSFCQGSLGGGWMNSEMPFTAAFVKSKSDTEVVIQYQLIDSRWVKLVEVTFSAASDNGISAVRSNRGSIENRLTEYGELITSFDSNNSQAANVYTVKSVTVVLPKEDVTFTVANATDWENKTLPKAAMTTSATDNISFAGNDDYLQSLGGLKNATVVLVTGCAEAKVVYGLAAIGGENNGIGTITRDVYLKVTGGNPSVISAGEDSLYNGSNKTKPTGNLLVNVGGTTTANHVMGAGNRGGTGSKITGHTGVVVEDTANIKGAIIGGWSSPHQAAPEVTGNTTVLIKNVQGVSETIANAPVNNTLPGWVIGGNAYLTNGGGGKVGGDSSVVIALDDDANGEFKKPIVGGSYKTTANDANAAMTHTGSTSVTISAPNDVTFSGAIYGACYSGNGGKVASVGGNSSVTINGGTYTGTIYAGGNIATYTTVAGAATLTINGGDLSAATLRGGQATGEKILVINENVTLAAGSISGFTKIQIAANKTLTLTVANERAATIDAIIEGAGSIIKSGLGELTLSGNNTYTGNTVVNGGMIKAEHKNAFGTGTVSVSESAAEGAVIVVPAFEEATSFTVNSAVIVVLTQAQVNGSFPLNTGIKTAANLQHTVNADDRSEITKLSASIATGLIYVVSSNKNVSWDSETSKWVDDDGNEVTTIDDTCTLVLNNGDDVSIPSGAAPSQITLPTSGRVAVGNIGNLADGTVIYIPEATTLALVSHTKTSNVKFDGPGAIELSLDSSNATSNLSNNWLDNTNYVDSFSGRIVLIQGRFETAEILAARVAVEVRDGAQLSTGGTGEWNNHFILHGDGCEYERGLHNTSEAALRLNNDLGSSAVLEFKQEDEDPKPVIGSHNHSATISAALKGTCGFKAVANENVTYTFKYNSASDLTGAVEFTNKVTPKLDFAGMSANQRINLGTSFNVPANKTLEFIGYTTSVTTNSETDKPGCGSVIALESGSRIYSDDGSYYVKGISVSAGATATIGHKWAKGWVYGSLVVPADATLNYEFNLNGDPRSSVFSVKSGTECRGTVNITPSSINSGYRFLISCGNSFQNAKAVNLNGANQTFSFNEFTAFSGSTVTVNNGAILDVNGKCGSSGYATVKLNGGKLTNSVAGTDVNTTTLINKTWPVTTLTLEGNSSIGGTQPFGLVGGSWGTTTLNLDTYTLTKTDANHVVLCTTTINGTGTLDVTAGQVSIRADDKISSAQNATIKVGTGAIFDIYNNQTFTVKNLLGNGGSFTTTNANGSYTVTGMLSGNGTFGRVTFANGATIDATSGTRTFSVTPTFAGAIKVKGTAGATILTLGDGVAAPTLPTNVTIIDDVGNEYVGASLVVEESAVKIGAIGAMAGGQVYADVATALAAVASTKVTVIPVGATAEVPAEYADAYVKTTVGSTTIIRAKNALIDWKSTNGIDWDAFNDENHVYLTQDGYDTTYQDGDTICFVGDNTIQVYAKTATYGAKMQVGKDATHTGSVGFTRSGGDCDDSIIDGSSIEIKSGSKLHILRWGVGSNWNSYENLNPKFSQIKDAEITGQGTIVVGKGVTLLLKDTEATATIEFADNEQCEDDQLIKLDGTATLTVTEKLADDKVVSNDASKLVEFDAMTKIYALVADGSAVALSNASVGGDSMSSFDSGDTYSITIPISLVGADSTKVLVRYIDVATDKASTDATIPNCLEIAELRSKPVAYTANGLARGKHRLRYEFEGLVLNCGQSYSVRVLNSSYSAFAARFLLRDCQNAGGATANAIIHDSKWSQAQGNRYCITCEVTANLIVDKLAANYVGDVYTSYGTANDVVAASKAGLIGLAGDVELSPAMGDVLTYVKNGNAVTISNGQAYEETILGVTTAIIANRIIYQTSSTGYLCKSPCNHSPAHNCIDDAAKFYLSADGSGDAVVWQEGDVIVMTSMSGYYFGLGLVGKTFIIPSNQDCTLNQTGDTLSSFKNAKVYVLGSINQGTSTIRNSAFVLCGGSLTLTENYTGELSVIGNGTATKSNVALHLPFYGVKPETEEEVVITEEFESLELQPGANVKVPVGSDSAKISVKYGSTVLTGGDQPKVTVTINQGTGKVELDVTAAAKPVVTEMTEADASNVSITFTPVAGLFYTLESGDTPDSFTPGDAEQAMSSDTKTLQLSVPTGDAKVKFYRVRVKATK